ncbi:MAG TPA: hypothetical protein VK472_02675 [Allosphingosinicella sp.]|nr:hypothetical protein [Allosphingosinicella sp.]
MREEQNQNPFAMALHWRSPSEPSSNLPAVAEGEPADRFDFNPVELRARQDGWTPERQRAFIEELADCGIVREAASRVGMTEQSATRLRRRADAAAFSLAWDAAVRIGADRLRSIAFDRAINGVVRPHYYRGQVVGEERVYNDRLLIYLLGRADPIADRCVVANVARDWDRWMEAIEDGLEKPLAAPGERNAPVWAGKEGAWCTSFPPPPGFNGEQHGRFGDRDYRRECTIAEVGEIEAARARAQEKQALRRDLYFHQDKLKF